MLLHVDQFNSVNKSNQNYNACEKFVVIIISASSLYFQSYQPIIPSGTLSLELSYTSGGTLINLRLLDVHVNMSISVSKAGGCYLVMKSFPTLL